MTNINEIYKCEICGNITSVIESGIGELVCCGQAIKLFEENTLDAEGNEKHVPVVETYDGGVSVKVGSVLHPMEENHHICLIQLVKDNKVIIGKRLVPGEKPEASFCLANTEGITAKALCNVHGLWKSK
ncbi:MAG: desulfoferrodoxin [Candidatus Aenigmatarchaeota archaeon]|nr:MAG: desulfoferrodoxin [Candidatus Aenigmarchaeota archaeon]